MTTTGDRSEKPARPRVRRTDPKVQLWRTVKHRTLTGKLGRTVWVSGDGYWIAHQSIVGPPSAKLQPAQPMRPKSVRDAVARYAADASTPFGKLAHQQTTSDLVIVGQASYRDTLTIDPFSPVRVAFSAEKFEALRRCVVLAASNATGFEMRVDPWKQSVSWWHPRGYPVAVLLGIFTPDDRGWSL